MKSFKIGVLSVLILASSSAFAEKVVVSVPGMVCQMCVQGMKKNFSTAVVNPDKDVSVDLDNKTVTVELKERISEEEIKERVNNAGYNAESIQWVE